MIKKRRCKARTLSDRPCLFDAYIGDFCLLHWKQFKGLNKPTRRKKKE